MAERVDRRRLQTVSPYITLVLVFACAWLGDAKPGLALAALAGAMALVAAQVGLTLWELRLSRAGAPEAEVHAREADAPKAASSEKHKSDVAFEEAHFFSALEAWPHVHGSLAAESTALDAVNYSRDVREAYRALFRQSTKAALASRIRRTNASETLAWAHATSNAPKVKLMGTGRSTGAVYSPCDLDKWKVTDLDVNVFNVDAGAFQIEHCRGRTVIRVRDNTKVTVEDVERERVETLGWLGGSVVGATTQIH